MNPLARLINVGYLWEETVFSPLQASVCIYLTPIIPKEVLGGGRLVQIPAQKCDIARKVRSTNYGTGVPVLERAGATFTVPSAHWIADPGQSGLYLELRATWLAVWSESWHQSVFEGPLVIPVSHDLRSMTNQTNGGHRGWGLSDF